MEPDISLIIDNPALYQWEKLQYYWQKWREVSGKAIRNQYSQYIQLSDEAAIANGKHYTQFKFFSLFEFPALLKRLLTTIP